MCEMHMSIFQFKMQKAVAIFMYNGFVIYYFSQCMQAQYHSNTPTVYTTVSTRYNVTNRITLYVPFCIACMFKYHNKKHSCTHFVVLYMHLYMFVKNGANSFLFLSFHRVLNVICSFLGNSPAS